VNTHTLNVYPAVPNDTAVAELVDVVPVWVFPLTAALLLITLIFTVPATRALAYRAGRRTVANATATPTRRDRALLIGALAPAVLFWAAVLAGSFLGLTGFARDTLHWTGAQQYLVPLTLDGIAVSFALLAVRAIARGRNPDRANRIAWAAMLASAAINFFHERDVTDGSVLGAGYLALLSVLGMLIFHEFLAQFEEGSDQINRRRPRFGLRWITYGPNTLCAALAWINHPPAEGTRATVLNAIEHLEEVRDRKRARRRNRRNTGAERITPEHRSTGAPEQSTGAEQPEQPERRSTGAVVPEQSTGAADRSGAAGAEQISERDQRALDLMLEAHPEPDYVWKSREVQRVTGAGFGRIPRLLALLTEHHRRSGARWSEVAG
jgi:hypothetical protein